MTTGLSSRTAKLVVAMAVVSLVTGACAASATNDQPGARAAAAPTAAIVPEQGPTSTPSPTVVPTREPTLTPELDDDTAEDDTAGGGSTRDDVAEGDESAPSDAGDEQPQPWEASPLRDAFFDADEIGNFLGGTWEDDYIELLGAEPGSDDGGPCGLALPPQAPGIDTQFFEAQTSAEFAQTIQIGGQALIWVDTIGSLIDCEGDLLGVEQVTIEVTGASQAVMASSPPAATQRLAMIAGASVGDVFVGLVVFADDRAHFPSPVVVEEMLARALNRASDVAS